MDSQGSLGTSLLAGRLPASPRRHPPLLTKCRPLLSALAARQTAPPRPGPRATRRDRAPSRVSPPRRAGRTRRTPESARARRSCADKTLPYGSDCRIFRARDRFLRAAHAVTPAPASRRAQSCRAPSPTIRRCGHADRAAAPAPRESAPHRARRTCPRRTLERKSAAAAQYGFETRRKRARTEWLGEKVVGAKLEDADFVVLVALRGQHDHGNVGGSRARAQV